MTNKTLQKKLDDLLKRRKKHLDNRNKRLDLYDKEIHKVLMKLKSKGGKK